MENLPLAFINSLGSMVIIVGIYSYIYFVNKEKYMGVCAISWCMLLSRYVLFDSGMIEWKNSLLWTFIYQMLIIWSVLLFMWGTYVFFNKTYNKKLAFFCGIGISFGLIIVDYFVSSLAIKLMIPIFLGVYVGLSIGWTYIKNTKIQGFGALCVGYAYIGWSILNITMPFQINNVWFSSLGYIMGGLFRLIIALGTLIVYFEKNRREYIKKESEYRLLAENAIDVIYSYQLFPERKFKYISPSALNVTGFTPEEYYNNNRLLFEIVHSEDEPMLKNFYNNLSNLDGEPLTLRLITKQGKLIWIEQKSVPVYNDAGEIIEIQGIIRDITARKELESVAAQFDRMNIVGNMAATVAHEIRNPMTTVLGYMQLLGRKEKYAGDRDKFKLMVDELHRANDIIREYLSLSNQKLVNLKKSSLNSILQAIYPLLEADASTVKVKINLVMAEIPELLLDANEIRQLVLNMVRNGVESMPNGGELTFGTRMDKDGVILFISDQGMGIPEEAFEKLGTPFFTTKDNGTGLGLSICYQIANRHNANIKINSSENGTTFKICFKCNLA
ncbi:PAS domain-containing sensor histidine kinase [Anaerosinus massiliensis]|uniref:PAS domain-containing sensor histidine kinase n=1 Tax=Massilibacillus massiliensis TaxID=1806837 RepID=UPI000A487D7B|nr:PAS domain-containing sensor histidine kinase [Massilibacillus massiliensis]